MSRTTLVTIVLAVFVLLGVFVSVQRNRPSTEPSKLAMEAGVSTISYNDPAAASVPERVGDLWLPAGDGPHPVVVVIHGGFWRVGFGRDLMDKLSEDLRARGFAAWNIEYRVVGAGGGWPETFSDVAAGVDHLVDIAEEHNLDLSRVATVGHSAGGQLALWAASRHQILAGQPGASPKIRPGLAVSQAGVADLVRAAEEGVGNGAITSLIGGTPGELATRYDNTSPVEMVPTGVESLLVHGRFDSVVPLSQSESYLQAAEAAGDTTNLEVYEGDHFEHLDPASPAWNLVITALEAKLR